MTGEPVRDWGFRRLDSQTAARNFAEWISDSSRRDWFRRVLAERGGPTARSLDRSPASVRPLGDWLLAAVQAEPGSSTRPPGRLARLFGRRRAARREAPPWAQAGIRVPFDGLSDVGLRLIDETAWYLTECYRARFPHSRCALDTDAASPTFNEPLVIGPGELVASPVRMVLEALEPLLGRDASADGWLSEMFDTWSAKVPEALRDPPRGVEWAYQQLSRAEAKAHFERYVATEGERLESFLDLVEHLGGPARADLDLSRGSLGPLGRWMLDAVVDGPRDGEIPLWAKPTPAYQLTFSGDGIRLMDGVATYFAAALHRRHPSLRWTLNTTKVDVDFHTPTLGGLMPVRPMLVGLTRGRSAEPPDGDWLLRLFDAWDEAFGSAGGAGADGEPVVDDVEVTRTEMPGYDVEIWIAEGVEPLIGADAFATLDERISAIPGISKLIWEDRELFYAKLERGTRLPELTDRVKAMLRELQADAQTTDGQHE
jgi:hypothetical protein